MEATMADYSPYFPYYEILQPLMVYQHSMSLGLISGKSERNETHGF